MNAENPMDFEGISEGLTYGEVTETDGKYLTFWTDNQLFGVAIADVVQIVGVQEITQIPEFPHYAKGIINLRTDIIPVIDVRIRIGRKEKGYDERTCIIVTSIKDSLFGFIVDAVNEVTNIDYEQISPPPTIHAGKATDYIEGVAKVDNKVVLLINTCKLLGDGGYDLISNAELD